MIKIVVAGSRGFNDYNVAKEYIDLVLGEIGNTKDIIFLSGSCRGADALGERYAKENGRDIVYYPAEWNKYKRGAGPVRNKRMAEDCDIVICFWNGKSKGTLSMINCAKKAGKRIFIKYI